MARLADPYSTARPGADGLADMCVGEDVAIAADDRAGADVERVAAAIEPADQDRRALEAETDEL